MAVEQPACSRDLRCQAEARLAEAQRRDTASPLTDVEVRRLLHELQIHEVERELQAEELLRLREQTEAALERYTDLYELAPIAYLTLGRTFAIAELNRAAARLLGHDRAGLLGEPFVGFLTASDRAAFADWLSRVWSGELIGLCEVTLPRHDAEPRSVQVEAATSADLQACRLAMVDITERKRAETERDRLAVAIEQADETIVITDPEGTIQYVNPMFERVTGYSRAEASGQNSRLLKSGEQSPTVYRELWDTIAGGSTWQGRLVNRKKDGTLFTEEATISPVRDAAGRIVNYVAVKRDITVQLGLEAELAQAQKMESIGRLAGGVAHDFNNMLGVILGHAELALDQVTPQHALYEDLDGIHKAACRSADLTRQLLTFARKQTIARRVLDLNPIVAGLLKMLQRLIGEHIELQWRPASDLYEVRVDPCQIDQMLANLCVNARDAIADAGLIRISTENCTLGSDDLTFHEALVPGKYVLIAVSDNGCGMDAVALNHIYEPFYTTKGVGEGTGLGLSSVYGAVKQNGGFMHVESQPTAGTTISIYLPRHPGAAEEGQPRHAATVVLLGRATILLVEDEPALLALTARMLQSHGYGVITAASPSEAIARATQHAAGIDLVITDVVMPEQDGPALVQHLLHRDPGLKHLYMSGHPADLVAQHGASGADESFIQKPFVRADLLAKVAAVLGGE